MYIHLCNMYNQCHNNVSKEATFSTFASSERINMKRLQEMYMNSNLSPIASGTSSSSSFTPPPTIATNGASVLRTRQLDAADENLLKVHSIAGVENSSANMQLQQRFSVNDDGAHRPVQMRVNAAGKTANHDEISKSLQMFAKTAYATEEQRFPTSRVGVDVVMQDFASNGRISDDLNNSQQLNLATMSDGNSNIANNSITNGLNVNQSHLSQLYLQLYQQQQLQQLSLNLNMWQSAYILAPIQLNSLNTSPTTATTSAATTTTSNIDYNSNNSNNYQLKYNKKLSKRYNNAKNDKNSTVKHCVFCENNNEAEAVVKSHALRDTLGRVLCPKLRTYICPICKASGDYAHTIKYCPDKPVVTMEDTVRAESFRLTKTNFYKAQMKV